MACAYCDRLAHKKDYKFKPAKDDDFDLEVCITLIQFITVHF